MNKKILIGSIIAVALLTLVSFTSVVGYSSVKSDSKIASPLFSVRNKKGDVSSDYLGKGKITNLLIPKRSSEEELFYQIVDKIEGMNDKSFDIFVNNYIGYINQNNLDISASNEEIEDMLFQMRSNPNAVKNSYLMTKEPVIVTLQEFNPMCVLLWVVLGVMWFISQIPSIIFGIICQIIPALPTTN